MNVVRQLKDKLGNKYYNTEIPYSERETRVGTWIDGKPLYRKVVVYEPDIHVAGSRTTVLIPHNISNLAIVTDLKFTAKQKNASINYVFPYIKDSGDAGSVNQSASINKVSDIDLELTVINDGWAGQVFYFTIEYTKTTD